MNTEIITALIALIGTLAGSFGGILVSIKVKPRKSFRGNDLRGHLLVSHWGFEPNLYNFLKKEICKKRINLLFYVIVIFDL